MRNKACFIFCAMLLQWSIAFTQIPVEIFGGNEKATVDVMFFKYFNNKHSNANSYSKRWLFFNRNRASVDYRMTKTTYLPQFGFTEAISYNHEKLKGFAPVLVAQILSWGLFSKAGIQYAHVEKDITIFTWLVCETQNYPDLDYFLLIRYTPKLTEKLNLFTQVESVSTFPSISMDSYSFTQRLRLGLSVNSFQFGTGADLNQMGQSRFNKNYNVGVFFRYEF